MAIQLRHFEPLRFCTGRRRAYLFSLWGQQEPFALSRVAVKAYDESVVHFVWRSVVCAVNHTSHDILSGENFNSCRPQNMTHIRGVDVLLGWKVLGTGSSPSHHIPVKHPHRNTASCVSVGLGCGTFVPFFIIIFELFTCVFFILQTLKYAINLCNNIYEIAKNSQLSTTRPVNKTLYVLTMAHIQMQSNPSLLTTPHKKAQWSTCCDTGNLASFCANDYLFRVISRPRALSRIQRIPNTSI